MKYTGRCEVCNTDGQPVEVQLVRWTLGGRWFTETMPRCVDRLACRARVEAAGHEWFVDDPA